MKVFSIGFLLVLVALFAVSMAQHGYGGRGGGRGNYGGGGRSFGGGYGRGK